MRSPNTSELGACENVQAITPTDSRNIPDGKDLNIQHTKSYTTTIGPLSKADLKALRKIIRKAIRDYEGNEHIQI